MNRLSADVLNRDTLTLLASTPADIVIYQVAASAFTEDAYLAAYLIGLSNCIELLSKREIPILFVSSTSVYHQDDGSQVDESSPVQPQSFNGQIMLQAERLVAELPGSTSIRFSGIYGPQRLRLIEQVRSGVGNFSDAAGRVVTNRIHSSDCAAVLAHLAEIHVRQDLPHPRLWLASDCEPAKRSDVFAFIREELGIDAARPEVSNPLSDTAESASKGAAGRGKHRRAASKRCDNSQLIKSGYRFLYPDYRSGYRDIIAKL